jgi:hypothetical protein
MSNGACCDREADIGNTSFLHYNAAVKKNWHGSDMGF